MKRMAKCQILCSMAATVLVSAFPALFMYCQNADEAAFSEIASVLALFIAAGLCLTAAACALTRSLDKGSVIAALFMLVLTNFRFLSDCIRRLLPGLKYWHVATILLLICLHIAAVICLFTSKKWAADVSRILALVYGFLTLFNLAVAAPKIIQRVRAQTSQGGDIYAEQTEAPKADNPNVYMFIFDEYASFRQMEDFYDYDNAVLKNFLDENRFSYAYHCVNDNRRSSVVQTNLVNLDYIVSNEDKNIEMEPIRKQGKLFSLMREKGYSVRIYETGDFYGGKMPDGEINNTYALTAGGETLQELALKNTVLYPFCGHDKIAFLDKIHKLVDYMSSPEAIPEGGTFTLTYLCFPHEPFVVDENGKAVPTIYQNNWKDKRYYLGQYKYATGLMLRMLRNIVGNDPDSVIMLMSDHGARATTDDEVWATIPDEVKRTALNAVFYRGQLLEIENLSLVNTVRTVLNKLWNMGYDMLNVPYPQ